MPFVFSVAIFVLGQEFTFIHLIHNSYIGREGVIALNFFVKQGTLMTYLTETV